MQLSTALIFFPSAKVHHSRHNRTKGGAVPLEGCWSVWRRVVYEVCGAECYGGTTPFSGFQSQAEGLMTAWMVFCPFFWAGVMAGDGTFIVAPCQSAAGQWGPQSSGLTSQGAQRNLSVLHVQWGVLKLQVCSMHSMALLWVAGTKGETVSVHVGGEVD